MRQRTNHAARRVPAVTFPHRARNAHSSYSPTVGRFAEPVPLTTIMEGRARFEPDNVAQWRAWLAENHKSAEAVWLVYRKKSSSRPNLSYSEAVDEALCFGWIDSKIRSLDTERSEQYYTPRKARSVWSKVNKGKIEALIAAGRMQPAGLEVIERAKANGSWTTLDSVHDGTLPADVDAALAAAPAKRAQFDALSVSAKRMLLENIVTAKRPETRVRRLEKFIDILDEKRKTKKPRTAPRKEPTTE